ncbi:MAG TPA: xylulokinase [Armatimonadota bacterium]|nr:xylulokinase [Armatimonadota bacterium]
MADASLLLGIDLGTSGCKTTLIDMTGRIVAEGMAEISSQHAQPDWSEQRVEDWMSAMVASLHELQSHSAWDPRRLAAVAIDGATHSAVLLDDAWKPLRPVIMWTDGRSAMEVAALERRCGSRILDIAYQSPSPTWTLPQLMWIAAHEPEVSRATRHILFAKDYLRHQLTGTWETDAIEAQGTLFYDMARQTWSQELFQYTGFRIDALPPIVQPTDIVGTVTAAAASLTGLPQGVPVVAGCSDSAVEDYAAGAVAPGQGIIKLATAGNVNVMTAAAHPDPRTLTYSHVIPGLWYTVVATNTAASAKRWLRDLFTPAAFADGTTDSIYERMDREAARAPLGSDGLVFHPYLLGERAPYWDPDLRASFLGLSMRHTREHFIRALLEGVAYSLRDCYSIIREIDLPLHEIRLIGGGAKSALWSRIVCDVFGMEVMIPDAADASYGSALLAGVGVGIFSDALTAVRTCVHPSKRLTPDAAAHEHYSALFARYQRMVRSLTEIYRDCMNKGEKVDDSRNSNGLQLS